MNKPSSVKSVPESFGVEAIPPHLRNQGWFVMFAMYAGINICLPMMLMGGLFVPATSFSTAVLAGLLGNGIGFSLTCLVGYFGVDQGLPASVATRVPLGSPRGTSIPSVAILLSSTGWFAVQAELGGLAADGVMQQVLGYSAPLAMIAVMGLFNVYFAVMGYGWMRRLASYSVPALLILSAWLFWKIAAQHPFWELIGRPGEGTLSFLQAVNIMVSAQVAGSFTASDLSRYAKNTRSLWWGIAVGVTPVAVFMIALGALSALSTGEWNPVLGVQQLGLGIGALLLIIFATWTTNDKNLYSGGLALTNLIPSWPRWQNTLLLGLLGTGLACFRLTRYFQNWLIALGIIFAPLVGVFLADYYLVRRRKIFLGGADDDRWSHYQYSRGINWAAVFAMVVGVFAGRAAPPEMLQPLVSIAATGVTYLAGMKFFYPAHFGESTNPSNLEDEPGTP